ISAQARAQLAQSPAFDKGEAMLLHPTGDDLVEQLVGVHAGGNAILTGLQQWRLDTPQQAPAPVQTRQPQMFELPDHAVKAGALVQPQMSDSRIGQRPLTKL